jgi:hypothetical protein
MQHGLKVSERFYADLERGIKPFEYRRNDRLFQVGDTLLLRKWHPETGYSGEQHEQWITYVLTHEQFDPVKPGFVILGLSREAWCPRCEVNVEPCTFDRPSMCLVYEQEQREKRGR